MKVLKILLLILILLIGGLFAWGFLSSGEYAVERSIEIAAKPEAVHAHLDDLKKWEAWGPWHDSSAPPTITYGAKSSGVGASSRWTDKNGGGELSLTKSDPKTGVKYSMVFIQGEGDDAHRSPADGEFVLAESGGKTKVTWKMNGKSERIMDKIFFSTVGEMMIGSMFDTGLSSLKDICEKKAE